MFVEVSNESAEAEGDLCDLSPLSGDMVPTLPPMPPHDNLDSSHPPVLPPRLRPINEGHRSIFFFSILNCHVFG